jgi:hypothetical protein
MWMETIICRRADDPRSDWRRYAIYSEAPTRMCVVIREETICDRVWQNDN